MKSALAISTEQRFQASRDEVIKRLPGAQLHAERELVLDMRPGREFEIEVPGQGYYLQRMYAVPEAGMRRFFLLVVAGGRIRPGCADARKFFDSFAVDTRAAEPLPSPVRPWQPLNRIQRVRRR